MPPHPDAPPRTARARRATAALRAPTGPATSPRDAYLDRLDQGVLMLDRRLRVVFANARFRGFLGARGRALVPGARLIPLLRGSAAAGSGPRAGAGLRRLLAAGTAAPVDLDLGGRILAFGLRRAGGAGWLATLDDVTERRAAEAGALRLAGLDPLTGLPNRRLFGERLGELVAAVQRTGEPAAVLTIDLDGFKGVNDSLGHPVGDSLLRGVAERLRGTLREGDVAARLGGDEFAVLQARAPQPDGAAALAQRLVDLLARAYVVDGHLINVGASIGIALLAPDQDADAVLRGADLALYRAKADGRGVFRFFEPGMDAEVQARRGLELDLRKALLLREFELHFQPQVNLERGRITGFEALLRWRHPERGLVSPLEFIPLAETLGLIVPIGEWVLRTACREAARWPGEPTIAVNLSPAQFKGGSLVATVVSALAASGLPAARLELEITESVLLQDNAATLDTLHRLRALGVRVSMDDFGTGYSSLSYLRSFPFDKIKIDRSFVRDMETDADSRAIVRAVAGLGVSLGMATTAEGVETEAQLARIRAEGCTEVQGYLVSRPVPVGEVAGLLAAERARDAAPAAPIPAEPAPGPVHRLVYCSRGTLARSVAAGEADVRQILAASRRNNEAAGVTGALLFNAGLFAQVLEGPPEAVAATFERIQRDPRHAEVTVLQFGPVAARGFPDWSMAYLGPSRDDAAGWAEVMGPTTFDISRFDGERVFALLRDQALEGETGAA